MAIRFKMTTAEQKQALENSLKSFDFDKNYFIKSDEINGKTFALAYKIEQGGIRIKTDFMDYKTFNYWFAGYMASNAKEFHTKETTESAERTCSECKKEMVEGYVINGGGEYYCSDKCLHKHYTQEHYKELVEDGDTYWTSWANEKSSQIETRVYVLGVDDYTPTLTDDEFIKMAEEQGTVYTLNGFQAAFNRQEINTATQFVRFVEMPKEQPLKNYFVFGSEVCEKLRDEEEITDEDLGNFDLFTYIHGETSPFDLLSAFEGWGDYREITEEQFNQLQNL